MHVVGEFGGGQVPGHRAGAEGVADDEVCGRGGERGEFGPRIPDPDLQSGDGVDAQLASAQFDDAVVEFQDCR